MPALLPAWTNEATTAGRQTAPELLECEPAAQNATVQNKTPLVRPFGMLEDSVLPTRRSVWQQRSVIEQTGEGPNERFQSCS